MKRNILVLNSSPREGGNTEVLADTFIASLNKKHKAVKIDIRNINVLQCKGCMECLEKKGDPCVQKDDMHLIYKEYAEADTLVYASPLYNSMLSGMMMTVINRLSADTASRNYNVPKKDCVLLMTAEDDKDDTFDMAVSYYSHIVENKRWSDLGKVLIGGTCKVGDINGSPRLDDARKLAISL